MMDGEVNEPWKKLKKKKKQFSSLRDPPRPLLFKNQPKLKTC